MTQIRCRPTIDLVHRLDPAQPLSHCGLVGARFDGDFGEYSGSAYIYTRTGNSWTEEAKLLPSDGAGNDYFGYSVALDGDTAIMGAYGDDDNGSQSGSVYIFTRTGETWAEQTKLLPSDGADVDYFGFSVALDGDTALVGAIYDDDNGDSSGIL